VRGFFFSGNGNFQRLQLRVTPPAPSVSGSNTDSGGPRRSSYFSFLSFLRWWEFSRWFLGGSEGAGKLSSAFGSLLMDGGGVVVS